MTPPAKKSDSGASFDKKLARIESIVAELEEGGLDLETAIARYKEGVELRKECGEVLAGFKKQVEELTQEAEDALRAYDGDPDVEDE